MTARPGCRPINGDATLLAMVLQNLIANAIKFRRPEIAARDHGSPLATAAGFWQFTCTDNGIGDRSRLR